MSLFSISHRYTQIVAEAVTAALCAAEAAEAYDPDAWAQDMTALSLAKSMAEHLGVPLDVVWHSLCNVPPNLIGLLDTPEGWGVLSSHICATLGHEPARLVPAVH